MTDKKDVLEFPLEELEVPQAIVLMMQAAAARPTISTWCDEQENSGFEVDNERLFALCEKLEAYIEDKLEAAGAIRNEPAAEDAPNEFEPAEESDTHLQRDEEGNVRRVIHNGSVFILACNERVYYDSVDGVSTTCIKEFGHKSLIHEDEFGNEGA